MIILHRSRDIRVFKKGNEEEELTSILDHLTKIKPGTIKLAKSASMEQNRITRGTDIDFDVLAMKLARSQTNKK